MNDLDLRAALHRDAELAGEPSPDLLDQLALRSDKQRRRRAGMLATAVAVVVIAAGIPVGQSLLAQGDGGPVDQAPVITTPSVEPTPTPTVAPPPVATATERPVAETPPATEIVPAGCPDSATLWNSMNPEFRHFWSNGDWTVLHDDGEPTLCSADGEWAWGTFARRFRDGGIGYDRALFNYVDGVWLQRVSSQQCGAGVVPADIWDRVCPPDGPPSSGELLTRTVSAADMHTFVSPSGNINCSITHLGAVCEIRNPTYEPPVKPSDCYLDHGAMIELKGGAPAEFVCHGDTGFGQLGTFELGYGERITNGFVTCASARTGMSCATVDGSHGLELSRASYRLY